MKKLLLCAILGFACHSAQAQLGTLSQTYSPHSPNAGELGKFVEVPVGYYSGIPQISVPLYQLNLKGISVPISLNYHASGLKVKDIPGWLGAGWSGECGGVISRVVRGYPDDHDPYVNQVYETDNYDAQIRARARTASTSSFESTYNSGERFYIALSTPGITAEDEAVQQYVQRMDTEYDLFYFNFGGNTGQFTFNNDGKPIMLSGNDLKIDYAERKFKITDAKGVQYYFEALEQTMDEGTPIQYYAGGRLYTTSWFMSKIMVPFTNETVLFSYKSYHNYELYDQQQNHAFGRAFNNRVERLKIGDYSQMNYMAGNLSECPPYDEKFVSTNAHHFANALFLDEITWEDNKIKFYGGNSREDLYKYKLDSIQVISAGNVLKRIHLYQDYFNPTKSINQKKLKLDSVSIDDQKYRFTYLESIHGMGVPPIFSRGQDFWGYYNGEDENLQLGGDYDPFSYTKYQYYPFYKIYDYAGMDPNIPFYVPYRNSTYKNPDANYAALGVLTQIQYPTGGKTLFTYEGNDYSKFPFVDPAYASIEDDPYTQLKLQNVYTKQCRALHAINMGIPEPTGTRNFVIHSAQQVNIHGYVGMEGGVTFRQYQDYVLNYWPYATLSLQKYNDLTGLFENVEYYEIEPANEIGYPQSEWEFNNVRSSGTITISKSLTLAAGRYRIVCEAWGPGTLSTLDVDAHFEFKKAPGVYNAGGLRIKKIEFLSEAAATPSYVKNYDYTDSTLSSGVLESPFANISRSFYYGNQHFNPSLCDFCHLQQICEFIDFYSEPIIPLGNAQGGVIGYKKVVENTEGKGKTVYHFTNGDDDPSAADQFIYSNYTPTRIRIDEENSWKRGLNYKTDYYDNMNVKVRKDTTIYTYLSNFADRSVSLLLDDVYIGAGSSYTGQVYYTMRYPRKSLPAETQTTYYNGAKELADITKYQYKSKHYYPVRIAHLESNLDSTIVNLRYPEDFDPGISPTDAFSKGIRTLLDHHVVGQPVEKYTQIRHPADLNEYTISGELNAYHSVLPAANRVYNLETSTAVTNYMPLANNGVSTSKDSRYQPSVSLLYDGQGYVRTVQKENGSPSSYLWGYNKQHVIAEVNNADSTQMAYSGFEQRELNSWATVNTFTEYLKGISFVVQPSRTGESSFLLATGPGSIGGLKSNAGLNTATAYMVSYWSKNTTPYTVAGTVGNVTQGETINGWTYFAHEVSGMTQATITGDGYLDDLRLHPKSALMQTYAYKPLVGMTSKTDGKNQTTYYEYDGYQRLLNIKDKDGNVLKSYDYHYRTQNN